jgi:hypothetical protein
MTESGSLPQAYRSLQQRFPRQQLCGEGAFILAVSQVQVRVHHDAASKLRCCGAASDIWDLKYGRKIIYRLQTSWMAEIRTS